MIKKLQTEEMVSGDAGGNPEKISAGTNSGAVVYPGPKTLNKKKKVKRMTEVIKFSTFVENMKAEAVAAIEEAKQLEEQAATVTKFAFKAFGANSVVVEATATEVKGIELTGKTSRDSISEEALKEAFTVQGKDGVLAYIKEATNLAWKSVAI
ncbi:MAG: hypothetical protein ACRC9Y_19210 [Aeromonas veronii]